ncbi:uncharacterized protein LOC127866501 [Dreissena polymorpha]|uniref:Uncharacterized protein n=1 Tax=Dreissena polymorpha TaxID=45954 RepID=A0A9D4MZK7_DREPO|nr:uncharacterized protein LOC127866501 [Dreissena polymorpha]KAH3885070.1 hypothetical protein DPMN_009058 [Dreissena polymorpha]
MLMANYGVVLYLAAVIPLVFSQICSESQNDDIKKGMGECQRYFSNIRVENPNEIVNACKNIDSGLCCVEKVFSACPQSVLSLIYRRTSNKAYYRAICDNPEDWSRIHTVRCDYNLDNTTCWPAFEASRKSNADPYYNTDHTRYKTGYCKAANEFVTCLENNPLKPTANCPEGLSSLLTGIKVVEYSLSDCGNAQKHPLFTKYGGPINCHSDGSMNPGGASVKRNGRAMWVTVLVYYPDSSWYHSYLSIYDGTIKHLFAVKARYILN